MSLPVSRTELREIIAEELNRRLNEGPPPTDEERVEELFSLVSHPKEGELEALSAVAPELIAGIQAQIVEERRKEFEQRQAVKERITAALASSARNPEAEAEDAPARRYAGEKAAWWEAQHTAGNSGPDIEDVLAQQRAAKEEAQRKRRLNQQAEAWGARLEEERQRQVALRGGGWFGWLRG